MLTMHIKRTVNSYGVGYDFSIWADESMRPLYECSFYGYSKRDAERLFRERYNLKGKHFDRYEW